MGVFVLAVVVALGAAVAALYIMWLRRVLEVPRASREKKLRVAVVGAGAAGMAAAYSLSRSDCFEVVVYDQAPVCGGVATSAPVAGVDINDGVQGGAAGTYNNVLELHRRHGFEPKTVPLNVSFGQGEHRWDNSAREMTPFMKRMQPEFARFAWWMRLVHRCEVPFMLVKIEWFLKLLRFSDDFANYMVLALTALFFGTGNSTRHVPAAVVARVFCDPEFRIFQLDEERFVGKAADFFSFANLHDTYAAMQAAMEERGVTFRLGRPVERIRRSGERVEVDGDSFHHLIMAASGEAALAMLGDQASWAERWVLGSVEYFDDVTVTHSDAAYMQRRFDADLKRPDIYYIRTYAHDPALSEMGFNLSNYQKAADGAEETIFQTIYLDRKHCERHWTRDEIDPTKVHLVKWWRQFAHTVRHFLCVVPWTRFIQTSQTLFAGSYLMVNTHESATISGFAAAHRLGAPYPFDESGFGYQQFRKYLTLIHGL